MDAARVLSVVERIHRLIGLPDAFPYRVGPRLDVGQRGQAVIANERIALLETVERGNVDAAGKPVEEWERVRFHIYINSSYEVESRRYDQWLPYAETACLRSAVFTFFQTIVADAVGVAMTQLGDAEKFTLSMESPS